MVIVSNCLELPGAGTVMVAEGSAAAVYREGRRWEECAIYCNLKGREAGSAYYTMNVDATHELKEQ